MDPREIVATAIIGTVAAIAAGWLARKLGRWLLRAIARTLADAILDVTKPEFVKVQHLINSISDANTQDHNAVQGRLVAVEARLSEVESRLAAVEKQVTKETP